MFHVSTIFWDMGKYFHAVGNDKWDTERWGHRSLRVLQIIYCQVGSVAGAFF